MLGSAEDGAGDAKKRTGEGEMRFGKRKRAPGNQHQITIYRRGTISPL